MKAIILYVIIILLFIYVMTNPKNENDRKKNRDLKPKPKIQNRRKKTTRELKFENSKYRQETDFKFSHVLKDDGRLGEYITSLCLENLDGYYKLLFNLYIPRKDLTTTEVDIVLLHRSGIHVFESKFYKGWIFGNDNDMYWTQSLAGKGGKSKKFKFYNPVWQNKAHITALKDYLNLSDNVNIYSYIVFSDYCEFKKLSISNDDHLVMQTRDLRKNVIENIYKDPYNIKIDDVQNLYQKLLPTTKADEDTKQKHIENIKTKYNI